MEFINRNPIIYTICGKSGSGKSQIATYIKKYYEDRGRKVIGLQYSHYIKQYAKKVLNWDGNEKTKPRDFLNEVGIELIKNTIDKNFSVRRLIEDVKVYSYFYDIITISDARFIEEVNLTHLFQKSVTIHVSSQRECQTLTEKQKKHSTNHGLDFYTDYDYEVENNSSLEDLERRIKKIIEEVDINEH